LWKFNGRSLVEARVRWYPDLDLMINARIQITCLCDCLWKFHGRFFSVVEKHCNQCTVASLEQNLNFINALGMNFQVGIG